MKFLSTLLMLFSFGILHANNLEIQIHSGFCASAGSGQAIVLVSGGTEPYTFEWNNPVLEGDEVFDLDPGTYSLTVTDASACSVIESFEIPQTSEVLIQFEIQKPSCFGESLGKLVITDFYPDDLMFSIDGINFSDSTVFENLAAGEAILYILESNGCITQQPFFIQEPPPLLIDFGEDISIELGESVTLAPIVSSSSPLLSIEWSTSQPLNCDDCLVQTLTPLQSFTVLIIIQSEDGCFASDEMTVNVIKPRSVFIPNAFSPNYDGINDIFYVFGGNDVVQIQKMIIRDNFGGIVHESLHFQPNHQGPGWDGTFKGEKLKMNVFIYQVTVEFLDGTTEDIFGTVTLLR